jgi:hypothetical protein
MCTDALQPSRKGLDGSDSLSVNPDQPAPFKTLVYSPAETLNQRVRGSSP